MNTIMTKLIGPEAAHTLALLAVRNGFGPRRNPLPTGAVEMFGCTLPTRVGLPGGMDKNAIALHGWQAMGAGFVEIGTVTPNPRDGNAKPRIWRNGGNSLFNAMGLNNLGAEAVAENLAHFRSTNTTFCVGASLANPDKVKGGLADASRQLAPYVNFFTYNFSCPNAGEEHQLEGALHDLLEILGQAQGKPVLVKLGPSVEQQVVVDLAGAFQQGGANGFIATNTVPHDKQHLLFPSPPHWPEREGKPLGGYSGPRLHTIGIPMIMALRKAFGPTVPLIGVGGIQHPDDAAAYVRAGADLVQLYTALAYQGVGLLDAIRTRLA